jgi:hypothetical protein
MVSPALPLDADKAIERGPNTVIPVDPVCVASLIASAVTPAFCEFGIVTEPVSAPDPSVLREFGWVEPQLFPFESQNFTVNPLAFEAQPVPTNSTVAPGLA